MPSSRSAGRCREVKVVLLGDTGVGKSSLAQRFVTNSFKAFNESTIGASFLSNMIVIDGKPVKLQIWDTAGQEKYHSLAPMYYRGAGAAILVYDQTQPASFEKLKEWVAELRLQGPEHIVISVAANKADLVDSRQVDVDEARAYAAEIGADLFETSAKADQNVADLFLHVANIAPVASEPDPSTAIGLSYENARKPRGSCCL